MYYFRMLKIYSGVAKTTKYIVGRTLAFEARVLENSYTCAYLVVECASQPFSQKKKGHLGIENSDSIYAFLQKKTEVQQFINHYPKCRYRIPYLREVDN